jgi:hypothetical protein
MQQTAPRRLSLPGAGGLLLLVLACAQVLDVDGIVITGGGPPPPPSPPRPPPTACTSGELHCEGAALQICRDDKSGFRTARVCSSAELCCADPSVCPNAVGCQAPACTPGDFKCDDRLLSVCNEALTGWTPLSTCASAAQCNSRIGRCEDQPCAPADVQCSAGTRLECGAAGWTARDTCTTRALCSTDATGPACKQTGCLDERGPNGSGVPSPFRCFNGDLLRCNDDQTEFEFVETCLNLLHCNALREVVGDLQATNLPLAELEQLGCTAPACTPGRFRCDGSMLMRCNQNRTDYQAVQDCGSPGRCSASTGSCTPQACTPGSTQCSGKEFQTCTADRSWQTTDTCAGPVQCDAVAGCRRAVCNLTDYSCSGTTLERCNGDGTDWIGIHTCETEALCNAAAKRCDAPLCREGELRCSIDGKLQRCAPGRNAWQTQRDCRELAQLPPTAPPEQVSGTCDLGGEGRCNSPPSCPNGSLRCNGQYLERCQDNAWRPRQWCATSSLCDASGTGSCREPTCKPGEYRCVTPGATPVVAQPSEPTRGLTLQVCDAAGAGFVSVRDCAADSFCDARHGQCDLCEALFPLCFGSSLYRCSADGQERELEKACASNCIVQPGGDDGRGRPACQEDVLASSSGVAN